MSSPNLFYGLNDAAEKIDRKELRYLRLYFVRKFCYPEKRRYVPKNGREVLDFLLLEITKKCRNMLLLKQLEDCIHQGFNT